MIKRLKLLAIFALVAAPTIFSIEAQKRLAKQPGGLHDLSGGRGSLTNFSSQANANDTNSDGIWVMIPNNLTENQLRDTQFDLFKLNTGPLIGSLLSGGFLSADQEASEDESSEPDEPREDQTETKTMHGREGRKMKFFPNFMKKPKVSPLYLVNGTVCRFVNSQPICTTLSTTGLFGNTRPIFNNNGNGGLINGLFQQGQLQQQQQGQNQLQNQFLPNGQQRLITPNNQLGPRF